MDQKDEKQDPVVDPPRRKHGPPKGGGGPHNLGILRKSVSLEIFDCVDYSQLSPIPKIVKNDKS